MTTLFDCTSCRMSTAVTMLKRIDDDTATNRGK
jgi:hypothetical protein